jgi:hypothetical protein
MNQLEVLDFSMKILLKPKMKLEKLIFFRYQIRRTGIDV